MQHRAASRLGALTAVLLGPGLLHAGSVGVWTKADTVTCFDDLQRVLHP